jgi:hypothetical protein
VLLSSFFIGGLRILDRYSISKVLASFEFCSDVEPELNAMASARIDARNSIELKEFILFYYAVLSNILFMCSVVNNFPVALFTRYALLHTYNDP